MAVKAIYGLQQSTAQQPDAPLSVTDKSLLRPVLAQFPLGEYFNRDRGWLPAVGRAVARFLSRAVRRRRAFVRQMDPRTADELLPDWEAAYDLEPTDDQTIDDRRDAVLAKVRSTGGCTADYYEQVAADFGYADAVVTDAGDPFTTESTADDFLQDGEWLVTFLVTAESQGEVRDALLQELINGQLLAGFYAIYEFT